MRFLITAGGTREYIDPVRFISNASSGKMGYALARAAAGKGHTVTLISGPTNLKAPSSAKIVSIQTSGEMFEVVTKHFNRCDCLLMAAAVSDFTVAQPASSKIKKTNQALTLRLKPTADILKWAAKNKREKIVVGFAL
ncbi:MAG: phosphopantothenoylcysteine decarboxylase domain-containing protein, partial [Planctomycetota bacterium]